MRKSSIEEIRKRFDNDAERFSTLSIGQTTTVDAVLAMDLITQAASLVTPNARHVLDVGCGAGNYTLKLLQRQRARSSVHRPRRTTQEHLLRSVRGDETT